MFDIYRNREDIWLSHQMWKEVDEKYKVRTEVDKSLVSSDKVFELDINNISKIPDGRIRIMVDGIRFECMFKKGKNDKLWVFPSAARTRANGRADIPLLERWSYYNILEDSILCVSDPMYYDYPQLNCGWFWGNDEQNYREYLALIVSKIVEFYSISKDNVVFMGVSAGGTTSIHTAAIFGHGTAISINGQLNFESETRTKRIEDFKSATGMDPTKKDKFRRNELHEVVKSATGVRFVIATNACSYADLYDHLIYFCSKKGDLPKLGLTAYDNVIYWLYEVHCKSPHNAFDDKNIIFVLEYLSKLKNENVEEYNQLYSLFSAFWNGKYLNATKEVSVEPSFEVVPEIEDAFDFTLVEEVQGILLEESENKYNRYSRKGFENGKTYLVKFNGNTNESSGLYTLGLYDCSKKEFVFKYTFSNNQDYTVAFCCNNPNVELCIYSGLYAQAEGKRLTINRMRIYEMIFSNISILKNYQVSRLNQVARLDCLFKNVDSSSVTITSESSSYYDLSSPAWINKNGKGFVISSDKGYAKIKLSTSKNCDISLTFRAADVNVDNRRLPIWVDYHSIKINDEEQLKEIVPSWHNKPLEMKVQAEANVDTIVEFRWTPHR